MYGVDHAPFFCLDFEVQMDILNAYPVSSEIGATGVNAGQWREVSAGMVWMVLAGGRASPPLIDGVVRVNGLVCEVELCLI